MTFYFYNRKLHKTGNKPYYKVLSKLLQTLEITTDIEQFYQEWNMGYAK